MRIALIGPGNTKFHYQELLKISEEQYKQEVWGIARALVNSNVEIELLPDDGICIELARQYKREGGRKVIASLPLSDKTFGVNHLKEYADEIFTEMGKIFRGKDTRYFSSFEIVKNKIK